MPRPSTVTRVLTAVVELAQRGGSKALTMEGIAAQAGVGKQTLYRTWPSVHAILFDALLAESTAGSAAETQLTTEEVLQATITEITTEPRASLLRTLAAAIQHDDVTAEQFHIRLLKPQQEQIVQVLAADGFAHPTQAAEQLMAPILFRWFLRLPSPTQNELRHYVENARALERTLCVNVRDRYR